VSLPLHPPVPPMEALLVEQIPNGDGWQYEPKWDGFRCLAFRDDREVQLQSKSGQPLGRYFPEIIELFTTLPARRFILDGELAVPLEEGFSFDELLQRIHPAQSRVLKLAHEHPAIFVAFDLLAGEDGRSLLERPLSARRKLLEAFAKKNFPTHDRLRLSPATTSLLVARKWFEAVGGDLDGIVAKRLDLPYQSGLRTGMQKIKKVRTADCVVGGFRYATNQRLVGSLLLGLYDEAGLLNHVGFCSGLKASERPALTGKLEARIQLPGFTGHAPGGLSRWSTKRSMEWQPLKPQLVVEVAYDHFTGGRFRHGTRLLRWRPDKPPAQCRMDQVGQPSKGPLALLAKEP
jgi:ATP-dependent DNA ligase